MIVEINTCRKLSKCHLASVYNTHTFLKLLNYTKDWSCLLFSDCFLNIVALGNLVHMCTI
jgi:hypothetical protein